MSALAWLLCAVPLAAGAGLTVAGYRLNRVAPAIGVAVAVVTLGLVCAAAIVRPAASAPLFAGIAAGLRVDGLSAVLVVTVAAVTLLVLVFSAGDLGPEENRGRFFGLMLCFAGTMLLTVTATTLPLLLMGWEAMGAASYALIGYWWREPRRIGAATTAFVTTRAADLGLYVAAGAALAGGAGGLTLSGLPVLAGPWLHVVTAGIVLAAIGKSAQVPFSFWLSRAMEGPSPVSALLHSATMVAAGAYLLLRTQPLLAASGWGGPAVAVIGVTTALVLGLVAVAQTDLKQLLAASTCAQIGFMVLAAGVAGVAGGTMQLVAHAAVKSLLFLTAGAWLTALGTKRLDRLRGAARQYRLVGVTFTIGAFALAGLPPASLWATKDEVFAAVLVRSPALYAAGLAAAVVSAVYSAKAVWFVWRPTPATPAADDVEGASGAQAADGAEGTGTGRVARPMRPPLVVLAGLAAVLGVLTVPAAADPLRRTLGAVPEPSPSWWESVLSAVLAVAACAVTWWWAARPVPVAAPVRVWPARWLDLERAAHVVLVRPTYALAEALAVFDDRVLDRAVHGLARGGLALARTAARVDDGGVDALVTGVATGARRLGRLARRPQTGQLHTYYAQLAVALVVLVLIFVLVR